MWKAELKVLTKQELIGILEMLSDDVLLYCNRVGNLAVLNQEADYLGFIDFAEGKVDLGEGL